MVEIENGSEHVQQLRFSEKMIIGGAASFIGGMALLGGNVLIDSTLGLSKEVYLGVVGIGSIAIAGGATAIIGGLYHEAFER